jgi:hypothetical protein
MPPTPSVEKTVSFLHGFNKVYKPINISILLLLYYYSNKEKTWITKGIQTSCKKERTLPQM